MSTTRRTALRTTVVALAWLVLVPLATLIPTGSADARALPEDDIAAIADNPEFGQRLSQGNVSSSAAILANRAVAYRALAIRSSRLPRPEWRIWPDDDQNQVVNLESFLLVTDGFESASWTISSWFVTVHFQSVPVWSIWDFDEQDTGGHERVTCIGPGNPWIPGVTNPYCGKEWQHSSDVTGMVDAEMFVRHLVSIWVNGSFVGIVPMDSPDGDAGELQVGEVLNVGQTIALPVSADPGGGGGSGFCSVWGINVVCWVGEQALDAAVEALYAAMPVLRKVVEFLEGCGDAFMEQLGSLVDILREIKDLVTNPGEFIDEKLKMLQDLWEAASEDPVAFAQEVLGEVLDLDRLDEEGLANWIGATVCNLAIEYFTGKAAARLIDKANDWLRKRRNGDNPDPDGDGTNPDPDCPLSSFPGHTQVLMADGSYQRIDSIRPGDRVVSHDVDTSVWEPHLVVDQWSHLDRGPPATLTLADAATITATDDHRFWRANTSEWVELRHLRAGDELLTPDGLVEVAAVIVGPRNPWTVWELTVADNHNFTVLAGDHDVLVHNKRCGPNDAELRDRSNETADRLRADGLDVTPEEVAEAWKRYFESNPDADFDDWQRQYESIRRNNFLGNQHEMDILRQYDPDITKNGQTFPDPDGGADFKPDAVLSTDPPHFVEVKDYKDTILYPGSNAGKQLKYITEHAIDNPANPGTFDLHITDPSNISQGMQDLIDAARDAGVTVRINPTVGGG